MNPRLWTLGALSALAVLLAGCGGSDNNGNNQNMQSRVRVLNGYIPAAGSNGTLNVNNGATSLTGTTGVGFGAFSPTVGYTTVSSGSFPISATGQGITTPIQSQNAINLSGNNTAYTMAVVGQSGQNGTSAPQVVSIPDYNAATTQIPTGQAAVRFINLSPGTNGLGLYNNPTGGTPGWLGNNVANVSYGYNSTNNGYMFVPAGTPLNLSFRDPANANVDIPLAGNSLSNITPQAGQAYSVYSVGQTGNASQPMTGVWLNDSAM